MSEKYDREWSFTCSRLDCQLHAGMHGPFRSEADALTASDSLRCPREHEFLWRCVIPWTRPQASAEMLEPPADLFDYEDELSHVIEVSMYGASDERHMDLVSAISTLVYSGDEPFGEVSVVGRRTQSSDSSQEVQP